MAKWSVGLGLCLGLWGLATQNVAHAEPVVDESRIESPRGMALGTGMRANGVGSQAQSDNPANLPVGGQYTLESFLGYQPQLGRIAAGASVTDSMTSRLAAGLSARFLFGEDGSAGKNSGFEGRLGLGVPLGNMVSIGLAGRYANFSVADAHARSEPVPEGEPEDHNYKLKGFTMDGAATIRPIQGLSISALALNFIDKHSALAPMMVGGSVAFGTSLWSLGGDGLIDLNKHGLFNGPKLKIGGGFEYLAEGVIPLRIGYSYDQGRHRHAITGGLGYVDQRVGVQLSMRQSVAGRAETVLMAALQYFVH